MRNTLFAVLFILLQISFLEANASLSRFEVIHSENTFYSTSNESVKRHHILRERDLVVLKSGYLMLINTNGEFHEFAGDTIIAIKSLIEVAYYQISDDDFYKPRSRREFTSFKLFSSKVIDRFYGKAVNRTESDKEIRFNLLPTSDNKIQIAKNVIHHLWWSYIGNEPYTGEYEVEFRNILDEIVVLEKQAENIYSFNTSEPAKESNLYLIRVKTVSENMDDIVSSIEYAFELSDQPDWYIPDPTNNETAIKLLELAYHLELNGLYDLAETYYRNAANLSDEEIYDDILEAYLKRLN